MKNKIIESIANFGIRQYIKMHLKQWDQSVLNPFQFQENIFKQLIREGKNTEFGRIHQLKKIKNYEDFKASVPLRDYEDFLPFIKKIQSGKKNILFPGKPKYFAKSSGTTSHVKFIPVYEKMMQQYRKAGMNLLFSYIRRTKNYNILQGKNMILQGSPQLESINGIKTGRMSGISYHIIPEILKRKRLPSYQNNVIEDWEEKIKAIARESRKENLSVLGGIPPWIMMYFEELSRQSGQAHIKDIFPDLKLYVTGGVRYEPYHDIIMKKIGKHIDVLDTYTASEGFIGFQTQLEDSAMTLLTDSGIFYEFVKLEDYRNNPNPPRYSLKEVEKNTDYVLILNTCSGLWGYIIGDTIRFTMLNPFKFKITGRVNQHTSLFGEHIIEEEVQQAIQKAKLAFDLKIRNFTVAPKLIANTNQSHQEWWIEFEELPKHFSPIETILNEQLCQQNPYYRDLIEGKVIAPLKIISVQRKGFEKALLAEQKIDGQNKIPILANNRDLADQLEPYSLSKQLKSY